MDIRKATLQDIDLLIKLRIDYLTADLGPMSAAEEQDLALHLRRYFEKHLADDTFIGMLAEDHDTVASTAYLAISEMPANPFWKNGRNGVLLNVLTYPEYRRQGLATRVLHEVFAEAKRLNVRNIQLSATEDGKPLYKKLGFVVSKYPAMNMRL